MKTIPAIDNFFNLEEALKADGFEICEKDSGECIAYFNQKFIVFNAAIINSIHTDMQVRVNGKDERILFEGVAPTNQHDYDVLMQLLFPSDEFIDRLYANYNNKQIIENQYASKPCKSKTISIKPH